MTKTQLNRIIALAAFVACIIVSGKILHLNNGLIGISGLTHTYNKPFKVDNFLTSEDQNMNSVAAVNCNHIPAPTFSTYALYAFISPATAAINEKAKISSSVSVRTSGQIEFLTSMDG